MKKKEKLGSIKCLHGYIKNVVWIGFFAGSCWMYMYFCFLCPGWVVKYRFIADFLIMLVGVGQFVNWFHENLISLHATTIYGDKNLWSY